MIRMIRQWQCVHCDRDFWIPPSALVLYCPYCGSLRSWLRETGTALTLED